MRNVVSCVGLFLLFTVPGVASAQSRLTIVQPRANVSYDASPKPDNRRLGIQRGLIHRRAAIRAAHRSARIEYRKWTEQYAQRPNIQTNLPYFQWYTDGHRTWFGRPIWTGTVQW